MEQKHWVLKPNVKKAVGYQALQIFISVAVIVGTIYFFNEMGVIEGLKLGFKEIVGEMPSPQNLLPRFIMAVFIVTATLVTISYIYTSKLDYIFTPTELLKTRTFGFIQISEEKIPYDNIVKVTFDKKTGADSIFGTKTITLELSGLKNKTLDLEYMDDAEKTAGYIQWILNNYRQQKIQEQMKADRVKNIIERY